MNIRPPLTFDVIKPDVTHYIHFNPETGIPTGCSVEQKGHSVKISEELAIQIKKGYKNLLDYRVKLVNNEFVVETKNALQNVTHNQTHSNLIENRTVYEIKKNNKDSCIRFVLDLKQKVWNVSIDTELKNSLKNTLKSLDTVYKFFTTSTDNSALLDYEFLIDIKELMSKETLTMPHQSDSIPRLFCRKVYNYSYEVRQ